MYVYDQRQLPASKSKQSTDGEKKRMRRISLVLLGVALLPQLSSFADELPIANDAQLTLHNRVAFTEGPVWHPSGNVYFSDIANSRIMRQDPKGELHVFRTPSGRTNGMVFDLQGRLIACEGGGYGSNRRLTRTEHDGTITVLAHSYQGKRINSPNDVTIDSKGRLYFSDPRYGIRSDLEQFDDKGRAVEGVYRIDDVDKVSRILTHEVIRPNGLAISPNDRYLFVTENVNSGDDPQNRKLWRFGLTPAGSVIPGTQKLLFDWGADRGPDGMAIDQQGRLYVTAGFNFPQGPGESVKKYKAGVYIISAAGKLIQFIPVPIDMITNCAFGGADRKTLYITAGHKLWSIQTSTPGHVAWPPKK